MEATVFVTWNSPLPASCDACGTPITDRFYDAYTNLGIGAILCPDCFPGYGIGLGVGRGQLYAEAEPGCFVCIAGLPPDLPEK